MISQVAFGILADKFISLPQSCDIKKLDEFAFEMLHMAANPGSNDSKMKTYGGPQTKLLGDNIGLPDKSRRQTNGSESRSNT